jgi:hypothetical protein
MVTKDAVDRAIAVACGVVSLEVDIVSTLKQVHQHNDDNPQGVKEVNVLRHKAEEVSQLSDLHFIHQHIGKGHVDPNHTSVSRSTLLKHINIENGKDEPAVLPPLPLCVGPVPHVT